MLMHEIFGQSTVPSMTSDSDAAVVRAHLEQHGTVRRVLELGPWLGALTLNFASVEEVHVVDNFHWTKDHDRRVPNLLQPGDSFKDTFAALMDKHGLSPVIHHSDFSAFQWSGGPIDLCVIDSAKTALALRECLNAVASGLSKGSSVLIKNGLHPSFLDMMLYLQRLAEHGVFRIDPAEQSEASNIIVLRVEQDAPALKKSLAAIDPEETSSTPAIKGALEPFPAFQAAILIKLACEENWASAYAALDASSSDPALLRHWKSQHKTVLAAVKDIKQLDWFSTVLRAHTSAAAGKDSSQNFSKSLDATLSAFWRNNKGQPWRAKAMQPAVLERAYDYGYMAFAAKIQDYVRGKTVLDVGCGPGLHGLGYLTAGATGYLGLDPIIKLDKDRVKNLSRNSEKMPFGWSPSALSEMIEPWQVQAEPLQSLPESDLFDFAVMHNVTEHLLQIEDVFAAIAKRLKPNGVLLYNHHNFYSWNGHHLPPKKVSAIRADEPDQAAMMDWGHVGYEPEPEHYIARGLNRIKLDDILALTAKYFDIVTADEVLSRPETGLGRLTDTVRQRHPDLTDRDFETQNLFCVARLKSARARRQGRT